MRPLLSILLLLAERTRLLRIYAVKLSGLSNLLYLLLVADMQNGSCHGGPREAKIPHNATSTNGGAIILSGGGGVPSSATAATANGSVTVSTCIIIRVDCGIAAAHLTLLCCNKAFY